MMLSLNRRIHRAYQRTRDANFSLEGFNWLLICIIALQGLSVRGKIGLATLRILKRLWYEAIGL